MDAIAQLKQIGSKLEGSSLQAISADKLNKLRSDFPGIPESYLQVLSDVGAGNFGEMGFSVYGGPIEASDIFDPITAEELKQYLFIGDDFMGWMAAFDTQCTPWQLCLFDHQDLVPASEGDPSTFAEFLCKELSRV